MNTSVALTFVLIVLARVTDVTLDTVRTVAIVQGRRAFSALLGFFEAVIYVCAVAKVLLNMDHPIYALAYGLGFALGNVLGITIEQHLAFGVQLASIFTKNGVEMARNLVSAGYRVAAVHAHVRNDDFTVLYVEVARKHAQKLLRHAGKVDEGCFCVINDVRTAGYARRRDNSTIKSPTHAAQVQDP